MRWQRDTANFAARTTTTAFSLFFCAPAPRVRVDVVDAVALDVVHGQHALRRVAPVHGGHAHARPVAPREQRARALRRRALVHEIELERDAVAELGQEPGPVVGDPGVREPRQREADLERVEVAGDGRLERRVHDLDRDGRPVVERRAAHLGDGRRRDRASQVPEGAGPELAVEQRPHGAVVAAGLRVAERGQRPRVRVRRDVLQGADVLAELAQQAAVGRREVAQARRAARVARLDLLRRRRALVLGDGAQALERHVADAERRATGAIEVVAIVRRRRQGHAGRGRRALHPLVAQARHPACGRGLHESCSVE